MGSNLGRFLGLLVDDQRVFLVVVDDVPLREEQLQRDGVHVRGHRRGERPRWRFLVRIRVVALHRARLQLVFDRQSFLARITRETLKRPLRLSRQIATVIAYQVSIDCSAVAN